MPEKFSWYIDNNNYPTREFVEKIISYSKEAVANERTVRDVNAERNPDLGNPSAAVTAARDFGLLLGETLSEPALLYDKGFYDYGSLIFDLVSKRNASKFKDIQLKPLVLVSIVLNKMRQLELPVEEQFIATYECYDFLSPINAYDDISDELVHSIVDHRIYEEQGPHVPAQQTNFRNVTISEIFSMFFPSKVFVEGERQTIIRANSKYWELIDFIAENGKNISSAPISTRNKLYQYLSTLQNGIIEIIPDLSVSKDVPKNLTKVIFEHLFGIGPILTDTISEFISPETYGIYRVFYPIKKIVFAKLYTQYPELAEHLVDYCNKCVPYKETMKEGRLVIQAPFENGHSELDELTGSIRYKTGITTVPFERNRIIFGAPGTGKSFLLEEDKSKLLENGGSFERVTFHPDYSYAHFVGTFRPSMNENDEVEYVYVPGPFMRTLVNALKSGMSDSPKPYLLLIEEINRANPAAVFGEVFQLLDRDDGISTYPVQVSEEIHDYLKRKHSIDIKELKIPDNMFIWATMNSADQGVFPMDTAFKRRWDFTYLGIDDNDEKIRGKYVLLGKDFKQKVEWNSLRKSINTFLAREGINEDKQLGPYFLSKDLVCPPDDNYIDHEEFVRVFKSKVIMYLFEDAGRSKRDKLFAGCSVKPLRYSNICKEFDEKGLDVFHTDIKSDSNCEPAH